MDIHIGKVKLCALVLMCGYVTSQEYYEEHHKNTLKPHLKSIPRNFEVNSKNAKNEFQRYLSEIDNLAKKENVTVFYKVKVEVLKSNMKKNKSKKISKKGKSKKYNVPLKKNSMKLSNFEVYMRKMAEENGRNVQKYDMFPSLSTPRVKIMSTRQIVMKYKPVITRIKTNYTKIVKPVRNKIITLTV